MVPELVLEELCHPPLQLRCLLRGLQVMSLLTLTSLTVTPASHTLTLMSHTLTLRLHAFTLRWHASTSISQARTLMSHTLFGVQDSLLGSGVGSGGALPPCSCAACFVAFRL